MGVHQDPRRVVHVAGIRIDPDGTRIVQVARSLLDLVDRFLRNGTHLIHDRDPLFTKAWTALLKSGRVKCVPIPAHSPNCSPHAERFVKAIRTECLDHFVIFGERHLRHLVHEFCAHYDEERFHQGLGGRLIKPRTSPSNDNATVGPIQCRSRLGGLLNFYQREAVTTDGGVVKQNGAAVPWDDHGYYEISFDAGEVTLSAQ